MPAFSLADAQTKLNEWKAAETALSTGAQSYAIAGRALTRANLREVGERVEYYAAMVDRLSARPNGGMRIRRVVPF